MPAETQSRWSWHPRKEFSGSLQLQMGRYSTMLWVFQVGLSCYPGMPLYPKMKGQDSCLHGPSGGSGGAAGPSCSLGTVLDPTLLSRRWEIWLDRISALWDLHGISPGCLLWSCMEESTVVSGRLDVILRAAKSKAQSQRTEINSTGGDLPQEEEGDNQMGFWSFLPSLISINIKKKLDKATGL